MSNYVKSTSFSSKDSLPLGDPLKIVKGTEIDTEFNNIATAVATKADLNSPALIGTPTAPTAAAGNSTTLLANTAFVTTAVTNERSSTATLTNKTLTSPELTGTPIAPTASAGTNTTQIATTAFTQTAVTNGITTERSASATLSNKTLSSPAINSPTISGGSISGISDLAVADGGTGASDAGTARNNLDVPSKGGSGASGTWGISITGNAASASNGFGIDQTWQSVSRSGGTWYQNTTSKPIMLSIRPSATTDSFLYIGISTSSYVALDQRDGSSSTWDSYVAVVPPNHYYYFTQSVGTWLELR